jgi:hypothetical protein
LLRYNKILSPILSNIETTTRICPNPPHSKPILSLISNGNAEEINKDRKVLTEKIDWINKGIKKNNNPTIYFDFVFTNTLKYTAIRPIKKKILMHTAITPRVGRNTSEGVSGVILKGNSGMKMGPNSSLKCCILSFASVTKMVDNINPKTIPPITNTIKSPIAFLLYVGIFSSFIGASSIVFFTLFYVI